MVFAVFSWFYGHRLLTIPTTAATWAVLFFLEDATYYWFHRTSHNCRYFWASHVIHHSSEEYNLGTALRQTWTGTVSGSFLFWIWLPLLGFHPVMIMTLQSISLLYQFWIHTESIGRLPRWFEWLFNTPSHHRVHHGADIKYLDMNHAGILIIWDRIFGTFQTEEEPPTYGLTTNLNTYNPFRIAFHEWYCLVTDIRSATRWTDRVQYLFRPPGWKHDGTGKTTRVLRQTGEEADRDEQRPGFDSIQPVGGGTS